MKFTDFIIGLTISTTIFDLSASVLPGLQTESQSATSSGVQTGSQSAMSSGVQTGSQSAMSSGVQTGSQSAMSSGSTVDISPSPTSMSLSMSSSSMFSDPSPSSTPVSSSPQGGTAQQPTSSSMQPSMSSSALAPPPGVQNNPPPPSSSPPPPSSSPLPPLSSMSSQSMPPTSGEMPQPSSTMPPRGGSGSHTPSMSSTEGAPPMQNSDSMSASIKPSETQPVASSMKAECTEIDSCNGMCTSDPSYKNTTDCSGTCNGTAYIDSACSGLCVGGTTGVMTNVSRDCNGICNGTNVRDSCDVCGPPYNGPGGSKYKGCDDVCVAQANIKEKAVNNTCGICTGGSTKKPATAGQDACGMCGGDNSTCTDCNGVPNGGKTLDACGECGGTGTSCLAVAAVMPDYIPAAAKFSLNITGAGLDKDKLECYLQKSGETAEIALTVSNRIDSQNISATVPESITAGTYTLFCREQGSTAPGSNATITVYDGSAVTVTKITPTTFTLGETTDKQELAITGTGLVAGHTYCMISDEKMPIVVDAVVSSPTAATCNINHPATSMAMEVSVSLNKVTKIGTPTTVKAQAAAPTAVAKFTDAGDAISVKFNVDIDTSNLKSCSDIFSTTLTDAECSISSRKEILIRRSVLAIGGTLDAKTDAIKQANEKEAIAFSDSLTIQTADNPAKPVVNIIGPSEVGGCVSDIVLDAGSSTGIGLTYTWTVSPTTTLKGSDTAKVTIENAATKTYTFTLVVKNNLKKSVTANYKVVKKSVNAPELFVMSTGGKDVRTSDRFEVVARSRLIDGCAEQSPLYTWSFDSGITADAKRKNQARYVVDANTLPAGKTITATVDVALENAPDTTVVSGSVTFKTNSPPISAYIRGAHERHIGVNSGEFKFDASISVDPSNVGNLQYEWNCVQPKTTSPCIFQGQNSISSDKAVFTMEASKLVSGNQYNFYVIVSSGGRQSRADVIVVAVAGDPPKVSFREIPDDGLIQVDQVVSLVAEIQVAQGATLIETKWEGVQEEGYGFIDVSLSKNRNSDPRFYKLANNKYLAAMSIKKDVLMKGQKYRVKVTVTDNSNNQVPSIVDFQTYQGVTSCSFATLDPYVEFSKVTFTATGCVTDSEGGALSYKLLVDTDENGNEQRLSPDSVSNSIIIPFAPKAYLGTKNKFTIEVCAQKGGCMRVRSSAITVTANTASAEVVKANVLKEVLKMKNTSNPLEGAVMLAAYLRSAEQSARRKRDVNTNSVYTLMFELAENVLNETKTEATVNTLLDALSIVKYQEVSNADLNKMVGYLRDILTFLRDSNFRIKQDAVTFLTKFADDVKSRSISVSFDEDIRSSISKAFNYGDKEIYTIANSHALKMCEDFLGTSYKTGVSTNHIIVNFGTTLSEQYDSWTCGSNTCAGVFIISKHYETAQDPYSTTTSDKESRVSDVLDLTIADPSSGAFLPAINNLADPITFTFPTTRPKSGKVYVCKFWDSSTSAWSTSGMDTKKQTDSSTECTTNHLSEFAVFASDVSNDDSGTNVAAIVGGVVGGLILIIIIVVIVIFVIKKKKNKVNSTEDLRQAEHQ